MRRGSLVDIGDLLHIIDGVYGVGTSFPSTYCGQVATYKLEAQANRATCVACIVLHWRDVATLEEARRRGYIETYRR